MGQKPRNVLLVWELGGSLGHLARLRPVARALQQKGHKVSLAVRQAGGIHHLPNGLSVFPLPTPSRGKVPDPIREPANFADILFNDGITLRDQRQGVLRSTRHLIDLVQPDLVAGDFSPWTLLALQGSGIPQALLGTGFACPPPEPPLPDLRAWQDHYPERIAATEAQVVAAINEQLDLQGCAPVPGVGALFKRVENNFLCTFAELDHYPDRSSERSDRGQYMGVWSDLAGAEPHWPQGEGPKVFGYLKHFRGLTRFLDQLEHSGARCLIFTAAPVNPEHWGKGNLSVITEPLDMQQVMSECELVICHAGHGTTATALLAGRPVMALPMLVEQYHTGVNVERMGAGISVNIDQVDTAIEACQTMLGSDRYAAAARNFAKSHETFSSNKAIDQTVTRLLQTVES